MWRSEPRSRARARFRFGAIAFRPRALWGLASQSAIWRRLGSRQSSAELASLHGRSLGLQRNLWMVLGGNVDEASWGWITYHYGRWYLDGDDGWVWISGDEWSPGWVDWRYGDQVIGWAPLAPEDVMDLVEERPEFWVFMNGRDFAAPRVDLAMLPPREASVVFGDTALVNRPVELRDRHFAVNPGIPAAFVAAAYGRPLHAFEVRPRVLAGTANVPGAMQVRAEDLRRDNQAGRSGTRVMLQPSGTLVSPTAARSLPPQQALARGEPGRLGTSPPLAARASAPPTTTGSAPPQPSVQPDRPPAPRLGERREGLVSPGVQSPKAPPERRATPNPPRATPPAAATREPPAGRPGNVEPPIGGRETTQQGPSGSERRSLGTAATERAPKLASPRRGGPPPPAVARQRQTAPAVPRSSVPPPVAAPRPAAPPAAAARPQGPSTTGAAPPGGRGQQRRE
jgi:hypothetical protein